MIISLLSDGHLGMPITNSKPYALLPIANRTLLEHLTEMVDSKVTILTRTPLSGYACLSPDELDAAALKEQIIIPGDILPELLPVTPGMARISEETEETRLLLDALRRQNISVQSQQIVGLRINYPWELLTANQRICDALTESRIGGTVEEGTTLKGIVHLGEGSIVHAGSYIEGPVVIGKNCEIGPHAHIRPHTSIGDGCRIGKTELVDAIILAKTTAKHVGYLGHSVIGREVNIGAGTITADYRHDAAEHATVHHGDRVLTGRRKLGTFIGDGVRTAIGTLIYPGRKLWPGTTTLPGEIVRDDRRGD